MNATGDAMSDEVAPSSNTSLPVRTSPDPSLYSISAKRAAQIYEARGFPRTVKTVTRHCNSGHLDFQRIEVDGKDQYFITEESLNRHIGELAQTAMLKNGRTGTDMSVPVAPSPDVSQLVAQENIAIKLAPEPARQPDSSRPVETSPDISRQVEKKDGASTTNDHSIFEHPYVKRLEAQVERLETKLDVQVQSNIEQQTQARREMAELVKASQVAQSETLAKYFIQKGRDLRDALISPFTEDDDREGDAATA